MSASEISQDLQQRAANTATRYEVSRAELPVHCPLPGTAQWSSHPRVYIPLAESGGRARCPYCGAEFVLTD
jgi:uncharacterized Zn-finger protein